MRLLIISIMISLFLRYTAYGRKLYSNINRYVTHKWLVWKYHTFHPWMAKNRDGWFLTLLAQSAWFPWYGRRLVHVKPRAVEELTATEADIKAAIKVKDYGRALELVNSMDQTPKLQSLKQLIEVKLENLSSI